MPRSLLTISHETNIPVTAINNNPDCNQLKETAADIIIKSANAASVNTMDC
jgi:hypothetical protein